VPYPSEYQNKYKEASNATKPDSSERPLKYHNNYEKASVGIPTVI
jgi:hypothetical protein